MNQYLDPSLPEERGITIRYARYLGDDQERGTQVRRCQTISTKQLYIKSIPEIFLQFKFFIKKQFCSQPDLSSTSLEREISPWRKDRVVAGSPVWLRLSLSLSGFKGPGAGDSAPVERVVICQSQCLGSHPVSCGERLRKWRTKTDEKGSHRKKKKREGESWWIRNLSSW